MTEDAKVSKHKLLKSKRNRSKVKLKHEIKVISELDEQGLHQDILREARALGIAEGAAGVFATRTVEQVKKWMAKRPAATVDDLNRQIAVELSKYNADLAYVYQNRGKII